MAKLNENIKIDITRMPDKHLVRQFERKRGNSSDKIKLLISVVVIVGIGILSGYLLSQFTGKRNISSNTQSLEKPGEKIVGSTDTKTFSDSAEGTLEAGSADGEGTHRLVRPGGESQTVYLTSSVLDLSKFEGKKVRVWGQTFAAKKAGWLMDVGKVEVLQ